LEGYPVKEYLIAGLYAKTVDCENNDGDSLDSGVKRLRTTTKSYSVAAKPRGPLLPFPINIGEWYLNQESDFSLPFDIIYEYDHALIKSDKQPEPYVKIQKSMLYTHLYGLYNNL
jgi:hypothetical protein